MQVQVNGEPLELADTATVAELLRGLKRKPAQSCSAPEDLPSGVAVAVNDEVISKSRWSRHRLENGDEILVITATQGG